MLAKFQENIAEFSVVTIVYIQNELVSELIFIAEHLFIAFHFLSMQ